MSLHRVRHTSPSRITLVVALLATAPGCVLPGAELVGEPDGSTATTSTSTGDVASSDSTATTGGSGGDGGAGAAGTAGSVASSGGGGSGGDGGSASSGGGAGGDGGTGGDGGAGTGGDGGGGAGPLAQTIALRAGQGHACVLRDDGEAYCWGRNDSEQVGFETEPRDEAWTPGQAEHLADAVVGIALGDRHTCATLRDDGDVTSIRCWGQAGDGQTGGNGLQQPTLIEFDDGDDVVGVEQLGGGWKFSCARLDGDGDVVCWGDGSQGALGEIRADSNNAVLVPLVSDAQYLATNAASSRACAVVTGGIVQCWGDGFGVETVPDDDPADMVAVGTVATLPPNGSELVFIVQQGKVKWTHRDAGGWAPLAGFGQFGETDAAARQVEVGQHEVCVVTEDDTLLCGPYDAGGLPDIDLLVPVFPGVEVAEVALGAAASGPDFRYRCVLLRDGRTQCQGSNVEGSVGNGAALISTAPVAVGIADVQGLSLGGRTTLAFVGATPTLQAWGSSQVTGVTAAIVPMPAILADGTERVDFGRYLADEAYVVDATGFHLRLNDAESITRLASLGEPFVEGKTTTLRDIGRTDIGGVTTYCRLSTCNQFGGMGDGTDDPMGSGDTVELELGSFVATEVLGAPTGNHHCALGSDAGAQQLLCWGRSDDGQVGDGTTDEQPTPTVIIGDDAVDACVGRARSCAVVGEAPDSEVRCWGLTDGGGPPEDSTTPVTMPGTAGAVSVTCGLDFTCAAFADKTVKCWGANDDGELGDGTLEGRTTPALVEGLLDAEEVVAGSWHACARRTGGAVSCWGRNDQGQLGTGVRFFYDDPVDVALGDGS